MMKPVNNHLLIEPLKHEQFISASQETYQEIGVVIDFDEAINPLGYKETLGSGTAYFQPVALIHKGDKVYFDNWLVQE